MSGKLIATSSYVENCSGLYICTVTQNLKEDELIFYCEKDIKKGEYFEAILKANHKFDKKKD